MKRGRKRQPTNEIIRDRINTMHDRAAELIENAAIMPTGASPSRHNCLLRYARSYAAAVRLLASGVRRTR